VADGGSSPVSLSSHGHFRRLSWLAAKNQQGPPMNSIQWRNSDLESETAWQLELDHVLARRALSAHFQPILRTRDLSMFGWEALIRGPAASPLARPDTLFVTARTCGRLSELDYACRATAIAAFSA
jgi:EAL domain-containing protein (putative c-di-GMP-specific phosphodiesterase class I)